MRPLTDGELTTVELLARLRDASGIEWGARSEDWQWSDALAIILNLDADSAAAAWEAYQAGAPISSSPRIRRHLLERGRGMSKTGDTAAVVLALMLSMAPKLSTSYVYAIDAEQADLLFGKLREFITATPGLSGAVDLGVRSLTVRRSSAVLTVETSDGASSLGLNPWLLVLDEFSFWPSTTKYETLYASLMGALPKVPDSRLILLGTGGPPGGLGHRMLTAAQSSPAYSLSIRPGPSPWWTREEIDATIAVLTPSEVQQFIFCEWVQGADSLTDESDIAAAVRPGRGTLPHAAIHRYIAALDIGTKHDWTVLSIGHSEHRDRRVVLVIDLIRYWAPPRDGQVNLQTVQEEVLPLLREYHAPLHFDYHQAAQLSQNLAAEGTAIKEYTFAGRGANDLAVALYGVLRDRRLELPDDEQVRRQFTATRIVGTSNGGKKLMNPRGEHDDIPTTVGIIATVLTPSAAMQKAYISQPAEVAARLGIFGISDLRHPAQRGSRAPTTTVERIVMDWQSARGRRPGDR